MKDAHSEALEKICGDMDDMESKKMFEPKEEKAKGVSITVHVEPKNEEKMPEPVAEVAEDDDMKLPPFLRKKK